MRPGIARSIGRLLAATVVGVLSIGVLLRGGLHGAPAARPDALVLPAVDSLRTGDLLFRAGVTGNSRIVHLFDPGSQFSHVGLVDVRDGAPSVIHVEPGHSGA